MKPTPGQSEAILVLLILTLGALYFFSFELSSPVNGVGRGPRELFEQDSRYILESLLEEKRYAFNPQHHLLYHVLVERSYGLFKPLVGKEPEGVYRFLKVFTLLTGLAFLFALSWTLREMGLSLAPRAGCVALAGVSVSAWFHFAGFETHSLPLAATMLYLGAVFRLVRKGGFGAGGAGLLAGSLVFAALCRVDLWRLTLLTVPLLAAPSLRAHRRWLAAALVAVLVLGGAGYGLLAKLYFGAPWREVPAMLFHRTERASLRPGLMQFRNFTSGGFSKMTRAASFYSLAAPVGKEDFRSPLASVARKPAAWPAFGVVAALWLWVLAGIPGSVKRRDLFGGMLWLHWGVALLFYTWFNPEEPFLWLLGFLPFFILLVADRVRGPGWSAWGPAAAAMVLLAHNTVFFYWPFR